MIALIILNTIENSSLLISLVAQSIIWTNVFTHTALQKSFPIPKNPNNGLENYYQRRLKGKKGA